MAEDQITAFAQQFVTTYYTTFDSNRAGLAALYVSLLSGTHRGACRLSCDREVEYFNSHVSTLSESWSRCPYLSMTI